MKNIGRILVLVLLIATVGRAVAQRPLIPVGSPGYLFMPPAGEDSVHIDDRTNDVWTACVALDFLGDAYRINHDTWVYGVALATRGLETYPYYWVYMMQERLVDSVNLCYAVDTIVADLYCFIERAPVSYADFAFGASGQVVVPCYEFYFTDPVYVPAGTRFYVGISFSPYDVYNHLVKDRPYTPLYCYRQVQFTSRKQVYWSQDPTCRYGFDGLDSTWNFRKDWFPGLVEWGCDRCFTPTHTELDNQAFHKYLSHGFIPIVQPPADSTRIFPKHEHPLKAEAVRNFQLVELDSAHATFVWDTFAPSDWGLVGVNVDAYEVNQDERQTDGQTGEVVGGTVGLCCGTEHYEHKEGGEHNLNNQTVGHTIGAAVGSCGGRDDCARVGSHDASQDGSGQNGTDNLEQHIHAAILGVHASAQEYAERDGRIDVATRDSADGVSHGHYSQTEGEGCSYDGCGVVCSATQCNGCTAAEECKHECAYQFC